MTVVRRLKRNKKSSLKEVVQAGSVMRSPELLDRKGDGKITQKELHDQIAVNISPETKAQFIYRCALHGVAVKDPEETLANLITGIVSMVGRENRDHITEIIL